jgi:3-hydroxyacyl-CoA dehydrogenase
VKITEAGWRGHGKVEALLRKGADPNALCTECKDELKDKPVVGMTLISGVKKAEGKDVWEGGKILDPENGKTYTVRLTPVDAAEAGSARLHRSLLAHPDLDRAVNEARGAAPSAAVDTCPGPCAVPGGRQFYARDIHSNHVPIQCEKVAVLGAGVMGRRSPPIWSTSRCRSFCLTCRPRKAKSGIAERAIANLKKLKPSPIGVAEDVELIQPANYEEHMKLLKGCDLVIEAIAERMDWKLDLYTRSPLRGQACAGGVQHLGPVDHQAVRGAARRHQAALLRHPLLQPAALYAAGGADQHAHHQAEVLDQLEAFVTSTLGKGVVRAHDTPNFIANRIGIAGMLATMKEVENFGLSFDVVDDLTGKKLGRASGTFRTADVVGLDTMAHVIKTLQDNLSLETDPFYGSFGTPPVLAKLIELGNLGQKTKAGFYKKVGRDICSSSSTARTTFPQAARPTRSMAACSRSPLPSA